MVPEGTPPGGDSQPSLFSGLETSPQMAAATGARAWIQAMLDFEAALARSEAACGLLEPQLAEEIAAECRAEFFDPAEIAARADRGGNPALPLVDELRRRLAPSAAAWVHRGATSQDVVDSAGERLAKEASQLILADLAAAADAAARLARRHHADVQAGRTLGQHAVPVTFGLKAAGWLLGLLEARQRLAEVASSRLALQLGGAAGTLAALGEHGDEVAAELAGRLGLTCPPLPWHTNRVRQAELAAALAAVSGVAAKIALDVSLLARTEVEEVAEGGGADRGTSSTMPHKHNPTAALAITASARRAVAEATVVLGCMAQEDERSGGGWQAEWAALTELLRLCGGAAWRLRGLLGDLRVDPARMLRNLELSHGGLMAERLTLELARWVPIQEARARVAGAVAEAGRSGRPLGQLLGADPEIGSRLGAEGIQSLLDPAGYLGRSEAMVERALKLHRMAAEDPSWS